MGKASCWDFSLATSFLLRKVIEKERRREPRSWGREVWKNREKMRMEGGVPCPHFLKEYGKVRDSLQGEGHGKKFYRVPTVPQKWLLVDADTPAALTDMSQIRQPDKTPQMKSATRLE